MKYTLPAPCCLRVFPQSWYNGEEASSFIIIGVGHNPFVPEAKRNIVNEELRVCAIIKVVLKVACPVRANFTVVEPSL